MMRYLLSGLLLPAESAAFDDLKRTGEGLVDGLDDRRKAAPDNRELNSRKRDNRQAPICKVFSSSNTLTGGCAHVDRDHIR